MVGVLFLGLAGCSEIDISSPKQTAGRNPLVAEMPDANETVRGEDDPSIVTLEIGSTLREHRLSKGDDLPGRIVIPTTNLNAVPITAALQAVLSGTDISLAWDTGSLGDRLVTVMNLSGPLPNVVEKICSAAKVFCSYRHGSLEISDHETFIVALPPTAKSGSGTSANSANSMIEAINQLIGSKAQVDEQGGNIIYTTDVLGEERAHQYLEQLRNGRPLVVLQLYVWEVTLNKKNAAGINWTQFNPGTFAMGTGLEQLALSSTSALTSLANTSGSVGLGAVTTGKIKTSSLATFLATQGRVQTISSPQITFVSGSGASLKIGGTQRYISQVGASTSNVSGSTTTSSSNTISTDNIDTGLSVDADGSYENGVIFANLNIALKNLVSLNPTSSGGQTIDLPETADEKITTVIRVRPGDNLVMAGLVSSSDTNNRQGVPLGSLGKIPGYSNDELENRELVVVVKPAVVLFSDKMANAEAKQKEDGKPSQAVIIDKDGAVPLTVPGNTAPAPVSSLPPVSYAKPELMVTAPDATPTQPIPLTPSADGAAVDKRFMQRGFSHAFDQLLQVPAPTTAANGQAIP